MPERQARSAAQGRPSFDECGFRPADTPCECGFEDEHPAATTELPTSLAPEGVPFKRMIAFEPAWDKRHTEPSKNYGVHGVEILFLLTGPLGATQFRLSTGWLLPETVGVRDDGGRFGVAQIDYQDKLAMRSAHACYPSPADLGYHSPRPIYDGQQALTDECPYIGGKCYYDGSGLNAWRPFEAMLRDGHEGVWRVLEDYYRIVFEEVEDEDA